jgi:hypothetical protein
MNLHLSCYPLDFPVNQQAPLALMQLQAAPTDEDGK